MQCIGNGISHKLLNVSLHFQQLFARFVCTQSYCVEGESMQCIAVVNAVHRLCYALLCQCHLYQCCTCLNLYEVGQCPCRNTTCQCVSACWVHSSHYSRTVLRARTTRQLSASLMTAHNCNPARLQNSRSAQTWALLWHWMTAFLTVRFVVKMFRVQLGLPAGDVRFLIDRFYLPSTSILSQQWKQYGKNRRQWKLLFIRH